MRENDVICTLAVDRIKPMSNYSVLRSSAKITFLTLISALLSFVNQLVVAKLFGASLALDVYLIAISFPTLLSGVISAAISYSMVPTLISYQALTGSYTPLASLMLIYFSSAAAVMSIAGIAATAYILRLSGATLTPELLMQTETMAHIAWVTVGFTLVASFLGAMQTAAKRFALSVVASMCTSIGPIVTVLAAGRIIGAEAIVWGILAGTIATVLILVTAARHELYISRSCFAFHSDVAKYFQKTPFIMLAMLIFTAHQFIDAYWAPKIGAANLSYLGYCQRLLVATGGFVLVGPSATLVPRIAEAITQGRDDDFFNDCGRAVRTVMAFGSCLAVIIGTLAMPVTEIIFQRGAFDALATRGVASILPLMMLGMAAMVGVVILFRALFAQQAIIVCAVLGILSSAVYFVLSGVLSKYFALTGIALAYAVSWWIMLALGLIALWRHRLLSLISDENVKFVLKLILSLATVAIAVLVMKMLLVHPLNEVGRMSLLTIVTTIVGGAMATFYAMTVHFFKMPDVTLIFEFGFSLLRNAIKKQ